MTEEETSYESSEDPEEVAQELADQATEGGEEEEKAKEPDIERVGCTRNVKYLFSDKEKLVIATDLARELEEARQLEQELTEIKSQLKGKIDATKAHIGTYHSMIYSGYEYRNVACELVRDYDCKIVTVSRMDTWEQVESRAMTQDELQKSLIKEV